MKALLLLLALSAQPVEFEQAAEVCVLEINHTYDANGTPCLDQRGPCREVRARHLRESWRQYDVEVLDQKRTPRDERVPLFREPQPTPAPLPVSQEASR